MHQHIQSPAVRSTGKPSTLRRRHLLGRTGRMNAALVSYYDMTLERIRERFDASDVSPAYAAVALRITRSELEAKLSGAVVLTVRDIGNLAEVLGCPMLDLIA